MAVSLGRIWFGTVYGRNLTMRLRSIPIMMNNFCFHVYAQKSPLNEFSLPYQTVKQSEYCAVLQLGHCNVVVIQYSLCSEDSSLNRCEAH